MKSLIVIPARGGSKGIPKKNIALVSGKPLLEYTIEVALKSGIKGDIVLSTDSDEIANVAKKYSEVTIIERPGYLAEDSAKTEDALLHAVEYMKQMFNEDYDCVITLQPTSPLRTVNTLREFIEEFKEKAHVHDAQLTLTESRSDYWIREKNGNFKRLFPDAPRQRQERNPIFIENSCIYITTVNALKKNKSVLGSSVNGYVIPEVEGIDINEPIDIVIAEAYLNKNFI